MKISQIFSVILFCSFSLFAKDFLTERRHIPVSIDTSIRATPENAESLLIRIVNDGNRRCYQVNGKQFNTKRKIKNNLDYTISYANEIRRSTNSVGIGVGFSVVTVIPFSKLIGVPLWGTGLNRRDQAIDSYNAYLIQKFGLTAELDRFLE